MTGKKLFPDRTLYFHKYFRASYLLFAGVSIFLKNNMQNRFERFLEFRKDFTEGRLSHEDELDLYAWRRLLPKNERAYRNRSSGRKISMMIMRFVDDQIWWERLEALLDKDEQFQRKISDMYNRTFNRHS